MCKKWLSIVFVATLLIECVISFDAMAQQQQSAADEIALERLRAETARIRAVVPVVWRENVLDAIKLTFPNDGRLARLEGWSARISEDYCDLVPHTLPNGKGGGEIVIGHSALILLLYTSQAITLDIVGYERLRDPDAIVEYLRNEVARVYDVLKSEKDRRRPDCGKVYIGLKSIQSHLGISEQEYYETMHKLAADPEAHALADYIGGVAIFVYMLHEAGHVWNDDLHRAIGPDQEVLADRFARDVIRRNEIPSSYGSPALLLLAEAMTFDLSGDVPRRASRGCRLYDLNNGDEFFADPRRLESKIRRWSAASERFRQYILGRYKQSCR